MPIYDFKCSRCKKRFTRIMSIADFETKKLKCLKCGSSKVDQLMTGFLTITSKKS